jgi:hypothetical protein
VEPYVPRLHVHLTPSASASGEQAGSEGVPRAGARAHRPYEGSDHPAARAGAASAEARLAGVLRVCRGTLPAARPGPMDPAAAAKLSLEAMGRAGIAGAAETWRGPAIGLEHGQVRPRPVAAASEPRAGAGAVTALLRRARPAEPVRRLTQPLHPPNRRIRDPYVRWCGRAGAARFPPIPIRLRTGNKEIPGSFEGSERQ